MKSLVIQRAAGPTRYEVPARAVLTPRMLTEKKILIVDDSAAMRGQIREALASAGFDSIEAADGLEGLQTIAARSDIAAVLCDVNMPRMNGLQMLEFVKAQGQQRAAPPIIVLTATGQSRLVEQAKKAGAKGWVVKPFKAALLIAAVHKVMDVSAA
jgi:two-component system chemotaxis response regulator CheY